MKASIDIGSNSIILLVIEDISEGKLKEILNIANVTALGKNLDKRGHFDEESKKNSFDVLMSYKEKIKEYNILPDEVLVTATEASRVASDSATFYQMVKEKIGFNVSIINAEGEAYYTALGVALGSLDKSTSGHKMIMDIGGASTELIKVSLSPFSMIKSISIPLGSVRARDYINNSNYDLELEKIEKSFTITAYQSKKVICVAGNMTTLACMMLELNEYNEVIHGQKFTIEKVKNFYKELKTMSISELEKKFPFIGKRTNTIQAGTQVFLSLAEKIKIEEVEISIFGLRHGVAYEGKIDGRFITA